MGLVFLVFLVTPLPLQRKATHFFLATASRLTSSTPITGGTTDDWAAYRVFALSEMWCLIARHSGLVGAWRLTGVCTAARAGAKEWLRKLPGIVVCGGRTGRLWGASTSEVWRLDLGTLRWERLPDLTSGRLAHACCAVRGGVVVLGGFVVGQWNTVGLVVGAKNCKNCEFSLWNTMETGGFLGLVSAAGASAESFSQFG